MNCHALVTQLNVVARRKVVAWLTTVTSHSTTSTAIYPTWAVERHGGMAKESHVSRTLFIGFLLLLLGIDF